MQHSIFDSCLHVGMPGSKATVIGFRTMGSLFCCG
jgi:hypothetical protein